MLLSVGGMFSTAVVSSALVSFLLSKWSEDGVAGGKMSDPGALVLFCDT